MHLKHYFSGSLLKIRTTPDQPQHDLSTLMTFLQIVFLEILLNQHWKEFLGNLILVSSRKSQIFNSIKSKRCLCNPPSNMSNNPSSTHILHNFWFSKCLHPSNRITKTRIRHSLRETPTGRLH